jgi:hypothetical protein
MSVPKAVFSLYFFASAWRPTDKCAGRRQGLRGRLNVGVANIVRQGRGGIRPHQHRMPIRVDQAGHQDAPAAVNRSRTSDRDRRRRYPLYLVVPDQNAGRRRKCTALSIEDTDVLKQGRDSPLSLCKR